jgi:hypothetical protein
MPYFFYMKFLSDFYTKVQFLFKQKTHAYPGHEFHSHGSTWIYPDIMINKISLQADNGASRFPYFVSCEGLRQFSLPLTGGIRRVFLGRLSAGGLHFLSVITPVTRPGQSVIRI